MKLQEKLSQLRSAAELKLSDVSKAIDADDYELAQNLQAEADALLAKAEAVRGQLAQLDRVEGLRDVAPEPVVDTLRKAAEPVRPVFDEVEDDAPAQKNVDLETDNVYVMRYGDVDSATKGIIKDIYGHDYQAKRAEQMDVFVKYIRQGAHRLTGREEALLQTLILRPDSIRQEIQDGNSVKSIKVTLQELQNDLGGYLVPEDFRAEIIKQLMGMTIVRPLARVVTTNRDAAEWPKLDGGNNVYTSAVRVTWVDEIPSSATVSQTNPTFGMLRVPVYTVMARTDLSRNLVEDSAFNLLQVVAQLFAEAMAIDEDNQFLTGTGGGTPKGILGNRSGAEQTPETGIATVVTGDAAALTADGLINLYYGLPTQYRGNAVFAGARNTHRDVRKLKDGNSRYLWEDSFKVGEPPRLLGANFLESENMPAVAANAHPIVFGDMRGYLIVDRVGMSIERVADTTTVGTNTVALFARRRLGGQVIEPWRFQAQKVAAS